MTESAPRIGRKCSKGHDLDPNWSTCPYCEAEERSKQRTSGPVSSGRGGTSVGDLPRDRGRRETRAVSPAAAEPGGHLGKGETRLIVGVLISYTWHPEGDLFPVREGKTFIGSGDVSSEAYHRPCDVLVEQDEKMSGEHALILCRHGAYEIIDQASSNGTFLNGEMLKSNLSTEIPNYAEIKTGSSLWTFIKINAPAKTETERPAKPPGI